MTFRVPRPISPQVHRNFDLIALPATFGLAYRMRHRNTTLATVVLINALIEGATQLTTDYTEGVRPRGSHRWISLRDHLRITALTGSYIAGLAATLEGLRPHDRRFLLATAVSAPLLAMLTQADPPGLMHTG
ncbi:hypothetical protein [Mycolicibacterium pyrenivorans]|uniref:hypothetical protein n=1 Tax=Mycolicibacterium pyrenivorans TaxID=187102 RepID=UPI0021F29BF8|nr:hypothetical protein [Mycolicibacterium pyrenivorans]MCV7154287.1 hypothetical protein [Mycolicibacterium pyrenivorans]